MTKCEDCHNRHTFWQRLKRKRKVKLNATKIEWVKNPDGTQGYTWNPITGCLNGCPYCYARKLANGRLRSRYLANTNWAREALPYYKHLEGLPEWNPFYPRFWEDRLEELVPSLDENNELILGKPKGIFPCDMSDLFGIGIPEEWTRKVMNVIKLNPQDRFYLLTKQPQNLIKFSPFPDNCWVGVTATDATAISRALYLGLGRIQAKVKYVSFEPLLGASQIVDIDLKDTGVNWVIIGAQTKPYKPPKIEWVEEIVTACDKAGVKVFLKNNLYPLLGLGNGKSICHNNEIGRLRQEMPTTNV